MRQVISRALLLAVAMGPAGAGLAGPVSQPKDAAASVKVAALKAGADGEQKAGSAGEQAPHLACEASLRAVAGMRAAVTEAAERGTLADFRKLHLELAERLRVARTDMEHAVFIGAWKDRAVKQEAFDLSWRIDAIQTLSFIALAFTSDYYPSATGKATPSVKDATRKLFVQLEHLIERVAEINQKVADAARSDATATRVGALR